jgi:hypothetical protein
MTIKVNKYKVASSTHLPLYNEVQGQETRAYIYINLPNNDMWVGCIQPMTNTWLCPQARGYLRSFRIPNNLTSKGYNDLLDHPTIRELADLMVAEASEYYDGNNDMMRLSQVGMDAEEALMNLCEAIEPSDYESLEPAGAHYYIAEGSYEALMSAGGTHEEVAERIVAEAIKDGYYLIAYDVEKHLDAMKEAAAHGNNI